MLKRFHLKKETASLVRVLTGKTALGTEGPVKQPLTEPLYLDVSLDAGSQFDEALDETHSAFIYVIEGEAKIESNDGGVIEVTRDQLGILSIGSHVLVSADVKTRFLLIAGKPLNEPIVRAGPFVMNTHAELKQAFQDYQAGMM